MDKKYKIMNKPQGAPKYINYGNVMPGEKGPRMGLRVTPELKQLINQTEEGKYVNFLLFEDDGNRPTKKAHAGDDNYLTNDEISF